MIVCAVDLKVDERGGKVVHGVVETSFDDEMGERGRE